MVLSEWVEGGSVEKGRGWGVGRKERRAKHGPWPARQKRKEAGNSKQWQPLRYRNEWDARIEELQDLWKSMCAKPARGLRPTLQQGHVGRQ